MVGPAGSLGLSGNQPFLMPVAHATELAHIEGVRAAVPIGQNLDKSDSGFGSRLIEGIPFDQYAALNGLTIREGRGLQADNEAIVDSAWPQENHVAIRSTT